MKIYQDVPYNQFCSLDVYLPATKAFETIVYFHGGGLDHGDKGDVKEVACAFVDAGYAFVSANYRLYPEVKYPTHIEDAAQAVAYVKAHIGEYGGNGVIYVTGSSAGAWLSSMLCLNKKYLQNVGVSPSEIAGWIIDSSQMTAHFNVQKIEKGIDPRLQRIDEFAPLYYIDADLQFSKMLLIFYENDMKCRYEQNMLFYKSVLHFNPQADICYRVLSGGHCAGISKKDENGKYSYATTTLAWLKGER